MLYMHFGPRPPRRAENGQICMLRMVPGYEIIPPHCPPVIPSTWPVM